MSGSEGAAPQLNRKRRPKARKSRAKAKKPKFLSLRLQFPASEGKESKRVGGTRRSGAAVGGGGDVSGDTHQLNLFPVHPGNQVEEKESNDHENVAFFFSAEDGGATTLTGLLDASVAAAAESNSSRTDNIHSRLEDLSPSSARLSYAYGDEGAALVRTALRNRERDSSEEKWVCYSEVVERKVKEEEVTSSAVDLRRPAASNQGLCLKLDYEEIMNAWSNKGPLFIDSENSQIVPDINNHDFASEISNNIGVGWGTSHRGLWAVPEMVGDAENGGEMSVRNGDETMKKGQREASVLRYKEKRQNRLFAKKIRYQVRKLNAEKRPRLKGRFVKRD